MGNWFFTVALAIGVVLILAVYLLLHRYGEYILVFLAHVLEVLVVVFIAVILSPGEFIKFVKKAWVKMKQRKEVKQS